MKQSLPILVALLLRTLMPFEAHAQSARMSSPNGGEIWKENEIHTITWNAGDAQGVARIYLETSIQDGETQKEYLGGIPAEEGKFVWAVPDLGQEPLQARIMVEGAGYKDASDAPFTILPRGSLSVRTDNKDADFALRGTYPNPAHDLVTFRWDPAGKSTVIAKLYNSTGAVVRTTSINGSSNELQLEVRDLPQGSYFYELLTDGHIARGVLTITR